MSDRRSGAAVRKLFSDVSLALKPNDPVSGSVWAHEHFKLPPDASAETGEFNPWKFQVEIIDAICDPLIPFVTVIKSARTGFTKSLVAAIGYVAANDPSPIMLLNPRDNDAREIMVDEVDPAFRESKTLRGLMRQGRFDGRNTLTQRSFLGGGSLKSMSAAAPANLRRHTVKYLFCDEVDGMKITAEGDPIDLAIRRTTSYADRKIVMGSTPTDDKTSLIIKRYEESDQRVFEIPCPHCEVPFELLWEHMHWERGKPETVVANCPSCGTDIDEAHKAEMVEKGTWRATHPEITDHAGFRLNALISLFANFGWKILIKEYEIAERGGASTMQTFFNTVLGKVWSQSIDYVNDSQLKSRGEAFGLFWDAVKSQWRCDIPAEVAYMTAGVDVQPNRIEVTFVGHSQEQRFVLGHHVIYGSARIDTTWEELLSILQTKWRHPLGGDIGIDKAGIDSGDGNFTQVVYDFAERVQGQGFVAIKGKEGARKIIEASKTRRRNRTAPLYIIGVDEVKTDILLALPLDVTATRALRFSSGLSDEFFKQMTSERRVVDYKQGRPYIKFERIGKMKAEALDTVVYALAVKYLIAINFEKRFAELKGAPPEKKFSLKKAVADLHR